MRSKKTKTKISPALLAGILTFAIVLVIYIGTSIYFTKHFYFGTVINGINATGKTVNEVETEVAKQTENYTLELKERDDKTETISSDKLINSAEISSTSFFLCSIVFLSCNIIER